MMVCIHVKYDKMKMLSLYMTCTYQLTSYITSGQGTRKGKTGILGCWYTVLVLS